MAPINESPSPFRRVCCPEPSQARFSSSASESHESLKSSADAVVASDIFMFLIVTICILFIYTVVLILFFMGWCTLIPTMCHPRREVPFSSVKSPRRNTRFNDLESMCSSQSLDGISRSPIPFEDAQNLSLVNLKPIRYNDYLHPKYSLPPIKIDVTQQQLEYERFLRTPIQTLRNSKEKLNKPCGDHSVAVPIPEIHVDVPYIV